MITRFLLPIIVVVGCFGQTAQFPNAIATDANLFPFPQQVFPPITLLNQMASTDTSFMTSSCGNIGTSTYALVLINTEEIAVSGCTAASGTPVMTVASSPLVGRGYDSTTAASHTPGQYVIQQLFPWQRNSDKVEIEAIEASLGVNLSNVCYFGNCAPPWILDANISNGTKIGGGTATDNTTVINNFLAQATATKAQVLTLTGATVDSGILIPPTNGNVLIQGCGTQCGFYTKTGSNSFGITNATNSTRPWIPFDPIQYPILNGGGTPTISNSGGVILRNFAINGNRGTQGANTGNVSGTLSTPYGSSSSPACSASFSTGPEKGYCTMGPPTSVNVGTGAFPTLTGTVQWVKISNGSSGTDCSVRGGSFPVFCYGTRMSGWLPGGNGGNYSFMWYTNVDLNSLNYVRIYDVHSIDSPTYGFRLMNVANVVIEDSSCSQSGTSTSGNHDCIHIDGPATNVVIRNGTSTNIDDDVWAANGIEGYRGAITNFIVDGWNYNGDTEAGNIYGNVATSLISHLQGTVANGVRLLSLGGVSTTIGSVNISDSSFTWTSGGNSQIVTDVAATVNKITLSNVQSISPSGTVGLVGCSAGSTITDIEIANVTQNLNAVGGGTGPYVSIPSGCNVSKLTFDGAQVSRVGTAAVMNFGITVAGTLTELVINSFNPKYVTLLVDSTNGFANISRVSGSGLIAAGYAVPDSIVVNGVPYLSSVINQCGLTLCPAIKLGGTAGGIDGTAVGYLLDTNPTLAHTVIVTTPAGANLTNSGQLGFNSGNGNTVLYSFGANSSTPGNFQFQNLSSAGTHSANSYILNGSFVGGGVQTISGCSLSSNVGSAMSGQFASGTSGTCTVTITPGFTAPNGFYCTALDTTTPSDIIKQTVLSTTAPVISGTTVSGDVVLWSCSVY